MAIKTEQSKVVTKDVTKDKGLDVSLTGQTRQQDGRNAAGGGAQEAIKGAHIEKEALGVVRQQKQAGQQMQKKAKEALEQIRKSEVAEKVEQGVRLKVSQEVQARIDTQTQQRDDAPKGTAIRGETGAAAGKRLEGQQPGKIQAAKVTLKGGVVLRGAKALGSLDPEKAKAQKREVQRAVEKAEKTQRKAEDARKISEEELLEKVEDKQAIDQQKSEKLKGGILRARSLASPGTENEDQTNERKEASAAGNTGGLGASANEGVDAASELGAITASSGAVQGSRGEQRENESEQQRPDGVSVEDDDGYLAAQQSEDALQAKQRQQELEEERQREELETEMFAEDIDLDVSNGFSAHVAADLHQDVRDIRALLVMADAYDRLQDHIQGDVLAANVAADGAASFAVSNVEAVQVASKRLKDQVGEVQPWQRFGML